MAARVSIPPTPAAEKAPDPASQKRGVAALRLELEATEEPARRAALSYELSRIHELGGDLAAAARDALGATNHAAGFIEPLEALIGIALRRRSKGNLEKLLERLLRVSRTPDERLRAGLELFGHLAIGGEFARAEQVLLALQEEHPDDPTLWLARQVLASHQGSEPELLSALLGRAASARSGHYRAELLQAAGLRTLGAGLIEEGLSLLQQAFDEQPSFRRARLAERSARAAGQWEQAQAFAERLTAMLTDADEAGQSEIPEIERGSEAIAQSMLRQALYAAQRRDDEQAARLLAQLSENDPTDWLLLALRRALSERGDADERARFEQEQNLLTAAVSSTSGGSTAGSPTDISSVSADSQGPELLDEGALELELWLVAQALGDVDGHGQHLERAARALPSASVPRAALLALASKGSAAQLARALANAGEVFSAPSRATFLTASALVWATTEPSQALRALEAAREAGQNAQAVRRILRVVALLSASPDLVLAAGLSLLEGARAPRALGWETLRLALLARNEGALQKALAVVAEGAPTRKWAGAFVARARTESLADLAADLSAELGGTAVPRALVLAQIRRELADGSEAGRASAQARLSELVRAQPGDSLATAALATLLQPSDPRESARLLVRAAESSADPDLAAAWATRGAVELLHAGRAADAARALSVAAPLESNAWGFAERYLLRALGDAALSRYGALQQLAVAAGHSAPALELACEQLAHDRTRALLQLRALPPAPQGAGEIDSAADNVLAWLQALLVAGLEDPTASVEAALPAWRQDEQAFLEFVNSAARGSALERTASAQAWLERCLDLNGPAAETTLDAALVSAVLSRQQGQAADEARALLIVSQALAHPWLEAQAHARLALRAVDPEKRAESKRALLALADANPDSPELSWAAFEVQEAGSPARSVLLERLATTLGPGEGDGDEAEVPTIRLLLAFDELRNGDHEAALARLTELQTTLPGDPTVLHGLRVAAQRLKRPELEVQALTALAEKCNDDTRASALWERAGDLYQHALGQPQAAEEAFCAALGRAPRRVSAFSRVYQLARARADKPRLVELIDARLDVAREPQARLELLWEKARLCRALGRRASCRKALELLLEVEPGHLAALALSAELHLADERFELAADSLRSIAEHPETPLHERAQAGLHASDLLERLHRPREAVALLEVLERFGAPRPDILERRARAAARAEAWDVAYGAFRELHDSGSSTELRLQGARMMLAIQRDHLKQPEALDDAAVRVLLDAPTEADAVDVVLAGHLGAADKQRLLGPAIEEAREKLRQAPLHPGHLARLCDLCAAGAEPGLERLALATWALTGTLSEERRRRLERATQPSTPATEVLSSEELDQIASAGELGALGALGRGLSPFVARLTRPALESLGASPLMRVDPFADHPARREVAELVRLLDLADFELYLGGNDPARLICFEGDLPTLLIGTGVQFPLSPRDQARLLTAVYGAARGFGGLWALPSEGARLWLGALLVALGRKPTLEVGPELEERAQALGQILPRETREELLGLVDAIVSEGGDPLGFANSARIGAARLASFLHGDPSILRSLPRLVPEETESRRQLLTDVVAFVFSSEFGRLRRKVGLEAP